MSKYHVYVPLEDWQEATVERCTHDFYTYQWTGEPKQCNGCGYGDPRFDTLDKAQRYADRMNER